MVYYSFFTAEGDAFRPTKMSYSMWSPTTIHGSAVAALLGSVMEERHVSTGFIPARFSIDLFKPVRREPVHVESTVVREGSRITLADGQLHQSGTVVARCSLLAMRTGAEPPGQTWSSDDHPQPPPPGQFDGSDTGAPVFRSGDGEWSQNFGAHQNAEQITAWYPRLMDVTPERPGTPFSRTVGVCDASNLIVNWGTEGVGYINADLTVNLARLPRSLGVGIRTSHHLTADGIAAGSTTIFDEFGTIGVASVSSVSNARRQIDFTENDPLDVLESE